MTRVQSVTAAAQATQSVHQTWTVLLCVHVRLAPLATGSPLAQVRADPFPVSFLYPLVSSLFLCMRASPLHKAIAPTCSLLGMAAGDQVQTTTCNDFDEELCPSSTNYVASSDVCDPTPCTFISCCGPVVAMLALGDSFQQAYARASCGGLCLFDMGGTSIAIPPLQPNKAILTTVEQVNNADKIWTNIRDTTGANWVSFRDSVEDAVTLLLQVRSTRAGVPGLHHLLVQYHLPAPAASRL